MARIPAGPGDWVERGYGALCRLYPAAFRARFGHEVLEFFRSRRAGARTRGVLAVLTFVVGAVFDLLVSVWRERFGGTMNSAISRPMFSTAVRDDLRAAARRLRRSPALTGTVAGLLALTIGSATVVFSVVNSVLLRPLPFGDPDRIVMVWETRVSSAENVVGGHEYVEWVRRNQSFTDLAAIIYNEGVHLTDAGEPMTMLGVRVSEPFFRVMGVTPAIGRAFTAEEDTEGHAQVAIVSDRLWRARFSASASVLGQRVRLNGRPFQIVGVMPPDFAFPPANAHVTPDVWTPIGEHIERYLGRHFVFVVGRLKAGVTIAQARTDMSAMAAAIANAFPDVSAGHGATVESLQAHMVADVRSSLMLLLGAVGCLLLIGCSNVASLLLARGLARRREVSLELALGATRLRVARQLLIESLAMSIAGGALGLALAIWITRVVPALVPPSLIAVDSIGVDRAVLAFAIGLSVITGLLFGVAPAVQLRRVGPADTLKRGGRSLIGGEHTRLRRLLVVTQVALAVLLVLGATLMTRGLIALHRVDPGFITDRTLTVNLALRGPGYTEAIRQREFFDTVETRVAGISGVASVGAIDNVPLTEGVSGIALTLEHVAPRPGEEASAQYRVVSPGFFKTMGVPIVAGRDFEPSDARLAVPLIRWFPQQPLPAYFNESQAVPAAVINESMTRRYWPDGAVGQRFKLLESPWITVVGVVADTHTVSLRGGTGPELYLTSLQEPQDGMNLVVRTISAPLDLVPAVRTVVREIDPTLPIGAITTMDQVMGRNYGQPRFLSTLMGIFAGIALLLMTVGVYGLLAFTTAQRLPEMGVRVALGAARSQIHRLVLREALTMAVGGVTVGLLAAVALGRFIADQLYGVTPTDRPTFAGVTLAVIAVVTLACWRPARRAARVDPIVVLRQE